MSGPKDSKTDADEASAAAAAIGGEISEHDRSENRSVFKRVQRLLHRYPALGPLFVLITMIIAFSFGSDRFLNPFNLGLITQQVMVVGTLAIGQTIIILTAGIDLSVGALAVFVSIMMGKLSADFGVPGGAALLIGFGFGTFLGLLNGLLITRLRLPPFIVTLGTLSIFFSLNLFVSGSTTIRGRDMDPLLTWTNTSITLPGLDVNIPISVFGMLIMYAILAYILRYTAWGRHVYAVGDNPESARLTGVRSNRVLLLVYAGAGLIYAVGAWFLLGRIGGASPQSLQTANLDTITAVVIGGTSLFGGRGVIFGTLIGAMIVGVAANGLSLAGIDPLWREFLVGALVIVAVALDQWIRRVDA